MLLQSKNSVIQQLWTNVPLKTRRPFRNAVKNSSIENIDAGINKSLRVGVRLFRETAHLPIRFHLDCAVSLLIPSSKSNHACDTAGVSMEANQAAEIRFHERIAIHHQKIENIVEKWLGEFHGPRSTEGKR